MMILLEVLKIIGIVLLVIIGLIIVIICLVLFAPFSYKVTGAGENEGISATLRITWLGRLLNLSGTLKKGEAFEFKTHFAGLEIKKKENSLISRIVKRIGLAILDILKEQLLGIEPEKKKKKAAAKAARARTKEAAEGAAGQNGEDGSADTEEEDAPKFIIGFRKFWEKVKRIWEILKLARYVLGAPVTARAWRYLKMELIGLLNHVKPKSMEGTITYGTGDPASTAESYGVAGWIASMLDERLMIIPDMDNEVIKMDVVIKGRIFVRYVLSFLWRILTEKNIRRVVGYIGRNL